MTDLSDFVHRERRRMEFQSADFVEAQLDRLRRHFRHKGWDDEGYILEMDKELTAMVAEFGQQRVETAVTRAIRGEAPSKSFMPTIGELRDLVPRRQAEYTWDPQCGKCEQGFVMNPETRKVKQCSCWGLQGVGRA